MAKNKTKHQLWFPVFYLSFYARETVDPVAVFVG